MFLDSDPSSTIRKFLEDPHFQDWVLRSDQALEDFWQEWISRNPDSYPQIKEARRILLEIKRQQFRLEDSDIQGIWKNILNDIQPKKPALVKDIVVRRFWGRGIAACLFLLSGFALYFILAEKTRQTTYRTGFGETLTITLPDSSQVILNSNSLLFYHTDWDSRTIREVWVDGEAFFDVRHLQTHQPFKVYPASGIEIEVLGTQFNVYHRNDQTKVLLSEGNVTMNFTDNPKMSKILMTPGDLVEYNQQKIQKKRVNPVSYVSWTKKVLQLESTSLLEMVRMAEENYGLKIHIAPTVDQNQSASGSMPLSDGDSFMKLTAKIFHIQVEYRDSIYYIK
ncbi:MAG TPA: FecR domain-containing protein [Algoriphagus sp.]|nr:FecR domain-containing protein [Algoriphagus sp.]